MASEAPSSSIPSAELRRMIEVAAGAASHRPPPPFGIKEIDEALPGSGLALGAVHEFSEEGPRGGYAACALLFAAGILARLPGPVLWCLHSRDLFAPVLARVGLHPDRIIFCETWKDAEILPAMEEGLRMRGLAGVVGELNRISLTPSRRLQLAAETSGVPALIIRRSAEHLSESNSAMSRWRISPAPSVETHPYRMGRPLWRVELLRCRGASPNSWTVEACNAEGRCALPADVPDRSDWRRNGGAPARELPMVTAIQESNRRVLTSVDDAARKLKLACGMTVAHAQTLVPDLIVEDAKFEEDEAALARLALWCTRYSPLVTPCLPDTIFIDVAGSSHLFKGEAALLKDMHSRLASAQLSARAAIADTPGCAWAVSHCGRDEIVLPGRASEALGGLPIAALRLPDRDIAGLRDVGIERIAQLAALPRASLRQRFSGDVLLRFDQALGATIEVLAPVIPREVPSMTLKFAEPIGNPDDLQRVMKLLCEKLMIDLAARGVGARRLDMVFQRVDNVAQAIRIGTSKPNRDTKHLTKLLAERLVLVEPGFGIEEATLTASWIEALTELQTVGAHVAEAGADVDVSQLVDTLRVRLGNERVFRLSPVESDIPERSARRVAATSRADGATWPKDLPRPARLLSPPEQVQAIAEIPDGPPRFFVWRKVRHRVARADGPERILGEWWLSDQDIGLQRDYYRVETEAGERFWLFRDAPAESGGRWWLHGLGEA